MSFIWCDNRDSVKQLCTRTRKWCWLCLTGNYVLPSGGLNAFLFFSFFFCFFSPKCVIFMKNKNAACWDSGINLGVLPVWVQLKLSNVYFNSVFWGLFRRSRPQVRLSTIKSAGTSVEIFQVPIANVFVNIIWENHNVSFREKGCFLKRKIPLTVQFIPVTNVFVVVVFSFSF